MRDAYLSYLGLSLPSYITVGGAHHARGLLDPERRVEVDLIILVIHPLLLYPISQYKSRYRDIIKRYTIP